MVERRGECYKGGREGSVGCGGEKRRVLNRGKGRERWIWWRDEESVK